MNLPPAQKRVDYQYASSVVLFSVRFRARVFDLFLSRFFFLGSFFAS